MLTKIWRVMLIDAEHMNKCWQIFSSIYHVSCMYAHEIVSYTNCGLMAGCIMPQHTTDANTWCGCIIINVIYQFQICLMNTFSYQFSVNKSQLYVNQIDKNNWSKVVLMLWKSYATHSVQMFRWKRINAGGHFNNEIAIKHFVTCWN